MDDLIAWLRGVFEENMRRARRMIELTKIQGVSGYSAALWLAQPADIEAKRAILELHATDQRVIAGNADDPGALPSSFRPACRVCLQPAPCPTLRLLVSAYRDRPGYREEWRP